MARFAVTETVEQKTARHKALSQEYDELMTAGDWAGASKIGLQIKVLDAEIEALRQIFFLLATGQFVPDVEAMPTA